MNTLTQAPATQTSNMTGTDPVAAAASLIPALRLRSVETDALTLLPEATIADLERTRLFDMLTPKMYGGLQCSLRTYMDAVVHVAEGDGSAGWTLALLSTGAFLMNTLYPKHVVDEVYAAGGNVRTAGSLSGHDVKTRRADGGVVIEEGVWRFNSGVHHAQWDMLGIPVPDETGKIVDQGHALVPVSQVTLLHDWDTIGLRGSGSTSVTVKNVFVPDERIASLGQALQGKYSASHLAHEPLYRMALIPFMATNLLLPALGIARAALELFMDKVPDRSIAFTWHEKQDEAAVTHLQLGEVSAKIDAAELMVRHCFDELEVAAALATAGDTIMPLKQRARIRRDSGFATQLIWEAMDMLAGASGGSFARTGNRMSHLWRDARVASLHGGVCPSTNLELFGRILCGKEPNTRLV